MDLNTIRTLIAQRNRYNEEIAKINGYLNQQYESAFTSGNIDQLRQLSEILSSKPAQQPAQQNTVQQRTAIPAKKQVEPTKKVVQKSSEDDQEDENEKHLNTWRQRVGAMSRNDLKENKKSVEQQVEEFQMSAENAKNATEKTRSLLSAEYYMKCLSILNDRIESEERKSAKHFEAAANAALARKDIMKNKQSISEAPSAKEVSDRNNKAANSDDESKKSRSKIDGSETKKPKIKIQIEASKSDDDSESNVETPKTTAKDMEENGSE